MVDVSRRRQGVQVKYPESQLLELKTSVPETDFFIEPTAGYAMDKVERLKKFKSFVGDTLSQVFDLRCEGLSWEEVSDKITPKR